MKIIPVEIPHIKASKPMLVDDEDFERLSQFTWYLTKGGYAYTYKGGTPAYVLAHRLVMNAPLGSFVDHKHGKRLDNRRSELRMCTISQNAMNSRLRKDNKSGFKGVSFCKERNSWEVYINKDKKRVRLGRFPTLELAIEARKNATIELHGEFAKL